MSKNFDNSVILPREDFLELQSAAYDQDQPSAAQRVATTIQITAISAGMAAAYGIGVWTYAKALDWKDERSHKREMEMLKAKLAKPSDRL